MRSLPKLAWWGLAFEVAALACFAIVLGQLYTIEHPVDEGLGTVINWTEARLVRRWAMAGIALFMIGATMLVLAARSRRDR
jgi:hypothetical protein